MQAIDAVYVWHNDQDPEWAELRRKHLLLEGKALPTSSTCEARFRSFDEMRFSLRSIQQNLPFIHRVYIIFDGALPNWLNVGEHLHIVRPSEIFEFPECIPSFSSRAIEAHAHRIPNISEYFIYSNDDMFFVNLLEVSDFLTSDKKMIYRFNRLPYGRIPEKEKTDSWLAGLANSFFAIQKKLGQVQGAPYNFVLLEYLKGLIRPRYPFVNLSHHPQIFSKRACQEAEELFLDEFRQIKRERFRTVNGYEVHTLRAYYALAKNLAIGINSDQECLINSGHTLEAWDKNTILSKWKNKELKFLCLNDADDSDSIEKAKKWNEFVSSLLTTIFPTPSRFEKNTL